MYLRALVPPKVLTNESARQKYLDEISNSDSVINNSYNASDDLRPKIIDILPSAFQVPLKDTIASLQAEEKVGASNKQELHIDLTSHVKDPNEGKRMYAKLLEGIWPALDDHRYYIIWNYQY